MLKLRGIREYKALWKRATYCPEDRLKFLMDTRGTDGVDPQDPPCDLIVFTPSPVRESAVEIRTQSKQTRMQAVQQVRVF